MNRDESMKSLTGRPRTDKTAKDDGKNRRENDGEDACSRVIACIRPRTNPIYRVIRGESSLFLCDERKHRTGELGQMD